MTSRVDSGRSTGLRIVKGPLDLFEERVRLEPEAEERKPENDVVIEREGVLPQGITNDVLRPRVVDAVHLDDYAEIRPVDVEVVAAAVVTTQHLTGGGRKATSAHLPRDIQLSQCTGPVEKVVHKCMEQVPTLVATDSQHLPAQVLRPNDPLLDRGRHQVRRLTVSSRPECTTHRSNRGASARYATGSDVSQHPPARLTDVVAPVSADTCAAGHGHTHPTDLEALQTGGGERRCPVEAGTRATKEDRRPPVPLLRERPVVQRENLIADLAPAPGPEVRRDLPACDVQGKRLAAGHHASLSGGEVMEAAPPDTTLASRRFVAGHADNGPQAGRKAQ